MYAHTSLGAAIPVAPYPYPTLEKSWYKFTDVPDVYLSNAIFRALLSVLLAYLLTSTLLPLGSVAKLHSWVALLEAQSCNQTA